MTPESYKDITFLNFPKLYCKRISVSKLIPNTANGQVYFRKPGTSDCDIHVPSTTEECHVKMLQRQIVRLPTGDRDEVVCDMWSLIESDQQGFAEAKGYKKNQERFAARCFGVIVTPSPRD